MTGWRNLDGSQRCQVHPGFTEQQAVRAKRSSKKRQTKPIKISHKSLALKELTSDRCKPLPIPFFLGLLFWMKKHQPLSFWGYFG